MSGATRDKRGKHAPPANGSGEARRATRAAKRKLAPAEAYELPRERRRRAREALDTAGETPSPTPEVAAEASIAHLQRLHAELAGELGHLTAQHTHSIASDPTPTPIADSQIAAPTPTERATAEPTPDAITPPPPQLGRRLHDAARRLWPRALKLAVALVVIVVFGLRPLQRLWAPTSLEAVVNARATTLRAPMEGTVADWRQGLRHGAEVSRGEPLFRVDSLSPERGRIAELTRLIEDRTFERTAVAERMTALAALQATLRTQLEAFQHGRQRQLDARRAEISAELAAAIERKEQAFRAETRARSLARNGAASALQLELAESAKRLADHAIDSLRQRERALAEEHTALSSGHFIGDGYNDVPASLQQLRQTDIQMSELRAREGELASHVARLEVERREEATRLAALRSATVTAPATGRVWELLTGPGEMVARGQDVARLLDCSALIVTATVSEASYNRLSMGDRAVFRFRGETAEHDGRIIALNGLASPPSNLAIPIGSLLSSHHVTVSFAPIPGKDQCPIGRTGTLTFTPGGGPS